MSNGGKMGVRTGMVAQTQFGATANPTNMHPPPYPLVVVKSGCSPYYSKHVQPVVQDGSD